MRTLLRTTVVAVIACVFCTTSANAAAIVWGSAQQITADADVSTTGTLVGAFNVGGNATTINGVNFQAFQITGASNTVGDFNLSAAAMGQGSFTTLQPPFSGLSSAYQSMVSTSGGSFGLVTLTMSNLTIGQQYQFQVWVNDSQDHNPPGYTFDIEVSAGNSIDLDPNPSTLEGGLGQYVIGTFTANAVSQAVTFDNSEIGGHLNGFQLRAINSSSPANVPLPPAVWGGLILGAAAVGSHLRRR